MAFAQDLLRAREAAGLTQSAAASFLKERGVKAARRTLAAWEGGENEPDPHKAEAVLQALRDRAMSAQQAETNGTGSTTRQAKGALEGYGGIPDNGGSISDPHPLPDPNDPAQDLVHIPEIIIEASAGHGTDPAGYAVEEINGEVRLPAWYIRQEYGVSPCRVRQVRVRGSSMIPTLMPGQRLLVALWDGSRIQDGLVYVLTGPGGLQVKRLFIEEEDVEEGRTLTRVLVWSDNPEAPRYRVTAERFESEYRVVAVALEISRKL